MIFGTGELRQMSDFLIALRFLTRIPAGKNTSSLAWGSMTGSLTYYSFVGAVLGIMIALVYVGAGALGLEWSGDVMVVVSLILLTGGLHLDGLGDTADGVFSCRSRERKLEIMRDSRIGTMGAVAIWTVLILKVVLLGEFNGWDKARILFFMPVAGRGAMVWAVIMFPYARKEGMGSFFQGADKRQLAVNGVFVIIAAFALFGFHGLILVGILTGAVHIMSYCLAGSLGGLTGDTYGALCETTEMLTLLAGAVLKL